MPQSVLCGWDRDLALLESAVHGVARAVPLSTSLYRPGRLQDHFDSLTGPAMLVHPGPGLQILDVNEAYMRAAMVSRRAAGDRLFHVFPDNPDHPMADGVSRLHASLRLVAASGRARVKPLQRYDVRDASGAFVERWWRSVHTPIFGEEDGRLLHLLVQVEEAESPA